MLTPFYKVFLVYGIMIFGLTEKVSADFLTRHAEGWHWYEDRKEKKKDEEKETPPATDRISEKAPEPKKEEVAPETQQLEVLQKELKLRRDKAVMVPTYANVKDYQVLQKWTVDHADQFSKMWMRVLYTTPELDTTRENPITQSARHVYLDQEEKRLEDKVKALSKSYGLFFFFKKGCAYCHHFAPIVKQFSARFGWKVLAITLDGGTLPEFPEAQMDNGAAEKLDIKSVPALVAVNPQTGHVLPLSFGMTTQDQILERIKILTEETPQ